MPTVLLIRGFRFFFYSNESQEPMHIHVSKGDADSKYGQIHSCLFVILTDLALLKKKTLSKSRKPITNNLKQSGMNTSTNNYDAIDALIYEEGLRIEAVDIHPELDTMLILLNTKAVLYQSLSLYPRLKTSDKQALLHYELTGKGKGIYWPQLDEDLSLKGFLRDELKNMVQKNSSRFVA